MGGKDVMVTRMHALLPLPVTTEILTSTVGPAAVSIRKRKETFPPLPPANLVPSLKNPKHQANLTPQLDRISAELRSSPLAFQHRPLPEKLTANTRLVTEDLDAKEHLRRARQTPHPSCMRWEMEDSLKFAVDKLDEFRSETITWRSNMNDEIEAIKGNMLHEIENWHRSVPKFVQMAYRDSGFCVPVFIKLLRLTRYPDAEQLFIDLSEGFKLTGDIASGVCWPPSNKRDPSYSWKEFYADNDEFITKRLSRLGQAGPVTSESYDTLLKELIAERKIGKVLGPFAAPTKWGA